MRLLSSYLTVNSKDGHGKFYDEIVLTTQGLGNDPYESAILRVQKNGLYRYDMQWRENQYYNPGLVHRRLDCTWRTPINAGRITTWFCSRRAKSASSWVIAATWRTVRRSLP